MVNYALYNGEKLLKEHANTGCYIELTTLGIPADVTDIVIWYHAIEAFTEQQIKGWIRALNIMGFKCKYYPEGLPQYKNYKHTFTVKKADFINKEHCLSTCFLIRYLWEYSEIVDRFFESRQKYPRLDYFRSLLLASSASEGTNHTVHLINGFKIYTKKEFMERLKKKGHEFSSKRLNSNEISNIWNGEQGVYKPTIENTYRFNLLKRRKNSVKNIYVVGGNVEYASWIKNHRIVDNIHNADLAIFTGGEDVNPAFYGDYVGKYTHYNNDRDVREKREWYNIRNQNIPMLGICRGSQFICVMNGGRLVQHQDNPEYVHEIKTIDGLTLNITSTHHQAATLNRVYNCELIAWTEGLSNTHLDGLGREIQVTKEVEIAYYPGTNCLGIQGHPEHPIMREKYPETLEYLNDLINKKLFKFS